MMADTSFLVSNRKSTYFLDETAGFLLPDAIPRYMKSTIRKGVGTTMSQMWVVSIPIDEEDDDDISELSFTILRTSRIYRSHLPLRKFLRQTFCRNPLSGSLWFPLLVLWETKEQTNNSLPVATVD